MFEWYWKQPGVPHVEEFVADIRKKSGGNVPTARTWFGYAAIWTCQLAAEKAKSLEPVKLAKAMQGLVLPPEVALMPNNPYYRIGDNQLMPTLFVGQSQPAPAGGDPEDLFKVTQLVKGDEAALAGRPDRLQDGVAVLTAETSGRRALAAPGILPGARGSQSSLVRG